MRDENSVPPGLWPFILEWCPELSVDSSPWWRERYHQSFLFYVLSLRPHLVKGKVESSIDADAADGPSSTYKN